MKFFISCFSHIVRKLNFLAIALIAFLIVVASTVVVFPAGASDLKPLTLNEVVRLGLKRSPSVKKTLAELNATRASRDEVKATLFPTIELRGSASEVTTSRNSASFTAGQTINEFDAYAEASQPLYVGGAVTDGLKLAKKNEQVSYLNHEINLRNTIRDIVKTFYRIEELTRLESAAQKNLSVLERHAAVINKYEKIGRARRADRLIATVNVNQAQLNLKQFKTELSAQKEELRKLLSLEAQPTVSVEARKRSGQNANSSDELIIKALEKNLELQISKTELEKIENEKTVALATDKPSLYLRGLAGYRSREESQLFDSGSEYRSVSLDLTVPVFSGLSSMAKRRGFSEKKISATRSLEELKHAITAQVVNLLANQQNLYEEWSQSEVSQKLAEEALNLANRDYERSLISSQDLISVQRTRFDTEVSLIEAQYKYLNNLVDLQIVIGENLLEYY